MKVDNLEHPDLMLLSKRAALAMKDQYHRWSGGVGGGGGAGGGGGWGGGHNSEPMLGSSLGKM